MEILSEYCSCCKSVQNKENLRDIKIGEHSLHLCSTCFNAYVDSYNEKIDIFVKDAYKAGCKKGIKIGKVLEKFCRKYNIKDEIPTELIDELNKEIKKIDKEDAKNNISFDELFD